MCISVWHIHSLVTVLIWESQRQSLKRDLGELFVRCSEEVGEGIGEVRQGKREPSERSVFKVTFTGNTQVLDSAGTCEKCKKIFSVLSILRMETRAFVFWLPSSLIN